MRDTMKKILGVALAAVSVTSVFAGCKTTKYKGDPIGAEYVSAAEVRSNGGFAVEKGDYVYFINAQEVNSANNKYGEVVKGALMRISKADLAAGKNTAITIVPSLFVAQNMLSGIWIYDDYVYYATPTTDKNLTGDVEYTYMDFKRAKLDGTAGPEKYVARIADNTANYRFVKAGYGNEQSVYCLYEEKDENGAISLKSYSFATGNTTVLVKGASQYFYDTKNMESGDVYYTMDVTIKPDSDNAVTAGYNQLYRVNAAATATVDAKNAKYTVYNGNTAVRTYDFDETYMQAQNDNAEEEKPYDFKDYSTYPYVNLGTIVLDGIGKEHTAENVDNRFVWDNDIDDRKETSGYKYTIHSYQGEGLYFTRSAVSKTQSDGTDANLYFLADADVQPSNSVGANDKTGFQIVALDTTNTADAVMYMDGTKQYYIYFAEDGAYRVGYDNDTKTLIQPVRICKLESGESATIIDLDETSKYMYYYSGTGNSVSRVKYDGEEDKYNPLFKDEAEYADYQSVTIPGVACNTSWYAPEFDIANTLLYSAAQTYGNNTDLFTYIHAAKLGTNAEIKARNEKYQDVQDALLEIKDAEVADVAKYYYRTGGLTEYEAAKTAYPEKYSEKQNKKVEEFVAKFAQGGEFAGCQESAFITLIGKRTQEDADAEKQAWVDYFAEETKDDEESGLPVWAIVLICVGGALIVAVAITIPLVISLKKKKQAAMEAEATVNAYKRQRIDTTDDKSIDVYAVEEETPVEETVTEEVVEETPAEETVTEEVVEETPVEETVTEEVVEETPAEETVTEEVVEETPAEEAVTEEVVEETPAEETVTEEVVEETPAEETVTEEVVEETPAEEAPVEEKTEEDKDE